MKKLLSLFFAISLTLSACGTVSTQPAPPAQIGTPTVTLTATQTPTSTITPLPTIPTFTPTFDVSTIVTVTPAEKAECPVIQENTEIKLSSFYSTFDYITDLTDALNQGASIENIVDAFQRELTAYYSYGFNIHIPYVTTDITNDHMPEILVSGNRHKAVILGCNEGTYKELYKFSYVNYFEYKIVDLNQNNIPEVLLGNVICNRQCGFRLTIIEWHNDSFSELLNEEDAYPAIWDDLIIKNLDTDKLEEIYWESGIPFDVLAKSVMRKEIQIYKWTGITYAPLQIYYSPPEFLFQAIQDADRETANEEYSKALLNYQNVIIKNGLNWWSPEREKYEIVINPFTFDDPNNPPTFPPFPNENPSEYPSLAAYAYYRIILLHLVQGQEAEAASTYQTLQDTFDSDPYGAPYVEMATAFWEAYHSTQEMYDGCAAAIQYAAEHPEILTPLGSDYHGWQSHIYVPADVCPFR